MGNIGCDALQDSGWALTVNFQYVLRNVENLSLRIHYSD